jgi:hypothetical protein
MRCQMAKYEANGIKAKKVVKSANKSLKVHQEGFSLFKND